MYARTAGGKPFKTSVGNDGGVMPSEGIQKQSVTGYPVNG
jgi:hypothetical protein